MKHYRIERAERGCSHCSAGHYWTVVFTDADGEECQISTSFADKEHVKQLCDWMNEAYRAGQDSQRDLLKEAKAGLQALLPRRWRDGTMDHMPGVKVARTVLAKLKP